MASLSDKRSYAKKRQSAVRRKIQRMESNNGVHIEGTKLDPRASSHSIDHMTNRQIDALINRLNSFQKRGNEIYGDAHGKPVSKNTYAKYLKAVANYNRRVRRYEAKYANVKLNFTGMTIGQARKAYQPSFPTMEADNVGYREQRARKSTSFTSEAAMRKKTAQIERRLRQRDLLKRSRKYKKQFKQMLDIIGYTPMNKLFDKMNANQLDVLWNQTNFASDLGLAYDAAVAELRADNKEEAMISMEGTQGLRDAEKALEEIIEKIK